MSTTAIEEQEPLLLPAPTSSSPKSSRRATLSRRNSTSNSNGGSPAKQSPNSSPVINSRPADFVRKTSTNEESEKEEKKKRNTSLLISCGVLLVSAIGNQVFYKKMIGKFQNYPYFLSQWTTLVYLPVFWGLVWYSRYSGSNEVTEEMRNFPKYKFFIMGMFDAIAGLLAIFGAVHTSGSMQSLLNQTMIPFTMILAYMFLKERYSVNQLVGASILAAGILTALLPEYFGNSGDSSDGDNQLIFNILFLAQNIPAAMSCVYKQYAFTVDIEANYLQAWVAFWQFLFGLVLAPTNAFAFLGQSQIPLKEIPVTVYNGFKCMIGINTVISDCTENVCDDCSGSWIPLVIYLAFNMAMNVALVLVIKYGGANMYNLVGALALPLIQLAFCVSFINNPPDPIHWYIILSLVLILFGLFIYRYKKAGTEDSKEKHIEISVSLFSSGFVFAKNPSEHFERRQNPQRIRSNFYSRLGIRESPSHSRLKESFKEPVSNRISKEPSDEKEINLP
jgi:drug/metabolite transporter (DMT)-like permease